MDTETLQAFLDFWEDIKTFSFELSRFIFRSLHLSFLKFEEHKVVFATALYRQRGKKARQLTHISMATLTVVGGVLAPIIAQEFPNGRVDPWSISAAPEVLSASSDSLVGTQVSTKIRDSIFNYKVQEGDTISSVAQKFGISADTIRWQNNITGDKIKVGSNLQILPVTGVSYKVQKGDTVYSIAKKFDAEAGPIIDFPFNSFANDETFELAIGQTVIVPDGVMPTGPAATPRARQITPDAGTVAASGQFVWPTNGVITQRFSWYHAGIDIANPAAPLNIAADSGRVIYAGWDNTGFGLTIVIDHGNGYRTRYSHLSQIFVTVGQTVKRGDAIGRMGNTGRSTGTHTDFRIYLNRKEVDPLTYLK